MSELEPAPERISLKLETVAGVIDMLVEEFAEEFAEKADEDALVLDALDVVEVDAGTGVSPLAEAGPTLTIEYAVVVTVTGLGDGVMVMRRVWVVSGTLMVWVDIM